MIQITSTLRVKTEHREDALRLALEHVAASRLEPGCISHDVFLDPEVETGFFFFERWRDMEAITEHFRQPHSVRLVEQMKAWAAEPISLRIVEIHGEQERPIG